MRPYGDADRDGLKNFKDCKPFDMMRKGEEHDQEYDEEASRESDESWEKLTPRQRALAQEGHTLGIGGW